MTRKQNILLFLLAAAMASMIIGLIYLASECRQNGINCQRFKEVAAADSTEIDVLNQVIDQQKTVIYKDSIVISGSKAKAAKVDSALFSFFNTNSKLLKSIGK